MSLGRIILKSTTRMSLNDRFTVLRKENPTVNNGYPTENRQLVQASRKNQRIAAQMERRPAVMAALKVKGQINAGNRPNINQNRLNIPQNRLNLNQKVSVKQRLALPGRLRIPETNRGPARGAARRGFANIKIRGGISGRGQFQGRIGTIGTGIRDGSSFRGRGRGGFIGNRGGGINQRSRGGQGGRGGNRGRGFSRGRGAIFRNGT